MAPELVVTGCGQVSAAGAGVAAFRAAVRDGATRLGDLGEGIARSLPHRFGGRFPSDVVDPDDPRRGEEAASLAIREALAAAGLEGAAAGLSVGTGLGPMEPCEAWLAAHSDDPRVGPAAELAALHPHAATVALARRHGLRALGTWSVTCVSALCALEQARGELVFERSEAVVVLGLETLSRTIQGGFCALEALSLSATPDEPAPQDGIVLGEAAVAVVLERAATARARGARVLARVLGLGLHADAVHATSPDTSGRGMAAAVQAALDDAGLTQEAVGAIALTAAGSPAYAQVYGGGLAATLGDGWQGRTVDWEAAVGHALAASGTLGLLQGALLHGGELEGPACVAPGAPLLALTVGFGGLNGACLIGAPEAAS